MNLDFQFFSSSILIGSCLAMDAFSVSLANGLNDPKMRGGKTSGMAGLFAAFQFAMPMIGWICVSTIAHLFNAFNTLIPWIAFALLGYIGGKMLYDGFTSKDSDGEQPAVGISALIVQGIATSIDALSVGFTISNYNLGEALLSCALIGAVTFVICFAGIFIGKKAGTALAGKATILGGAILIIIGTKILVESFM